MNHDERFEERLRELVHASDPGDDPTQAWKAGILAAATTEPAPSRSFAPPRPLLIAWAIAWTTIALLSWSNPEETENDLSTAIAPASPVSVLLANRSALIRHLELP